ncbi:hypothetical protein C4569_03785, partial [Candidatus Parcubacteria bacterium]
VKKKIPESVSIFIAPQSYNELKKRLIKRGSDSIKTIEKRKKFSQQWLRQKKVYDFVIINKQGKLKDTVNKVYDIINN